jgi:hypothetical protein
MPNLEARRLRRDMTDAERRLWAVLRGRQLDGYEFRRQHPVGRFIREAMLDAGEIARPGSRARAGGCSASGTTTSWRTRKLSNRRYCGR